MKRNFLDTLDMDTLLDDANQTADDIIYALSIGDNENAKRLKTILDQYVNAITKRIK